MLYHLVCQHHHVYLILYHVMFHLVTTCVCRLIHIHLCIHDLADGVNYNLLYNERNDQLLLRKDGRRLCCINLDDHVIYRYDILGYLGLAVDQQGHVYISGCESNDIHRLSPDGICALRNKKINILTLVLSEKKILNETKNHNPPSS
jgi:hypothetical protein